MSRQRTFANDVACVSESRRFVLDAVGALSPGIADSIAVMVSELTANAVRHTGSQFTVTVDRSAAQIRVEVSDTGSGDPIVRSPGPADPSGRGLRIIEALAGDWGVIPAVGAQGKTVWFTIAVESELEDGPEIALDVSAPAQRSEMRAGEAPGAPPASDGGGTLRCRARRAGNRNFTFAWISDWVPDRCVNSSRTPIRAATGKCR